jgi:Domain of unknown function (DUF4190)/GYF domain 2
MAQWFYGENNQQFGPIEDAEFYRLIAAQRITATTKVWRDGMAGWAGLADAQASGQVNPTAAVSGPSVYFPQPGNSPYGVPIPQASGLAIASLVTGIFGLISCLSFLGIPAVICGHMALFQIAKSPLTRNGRGMAITGLVCGYVMILMLIAALIFFVWGFAEFQKLSLH